MEISAGERKAAELLLERNYAPKAERISLEEIAEETGISVRQLYNIRQKVGFLRYYRALTETKLVSMHLFIDSQLMKAIAGGNNRLPSTKAIELCYKLTGRLNEGTTINFNSDNVAKSRMNDDQVGMNSLSFAKNSSCSKKQKQPRLLGLLVYTKSESGSHLHFINLLCKGSKKLNTTKYKGIEMKKLQP